MRDLSALIDIAPFLHGGEADRQAVVEAFGRAFETLCFRRTWAISRHLAEVPRREFCVSIGRREKRRGSARRLGESGAHGLQPHRVRQLELSKDSESVGKLREATRTISSPPSSVGIKCQIRGKKSVTRIDTCYKMAASKG